MNENRILLCGLPASGKTTFLAALWHLVSQREVPTTLSLGAWPKHREYLNELSRKWSRFVPFDRTPTDEVQEISIHLKDGTTHIDLHVPDMSGETWEALWSTRSCGDDAAKWAQTASGIMLFLHADRIRPPLEIMTCKEMAEASGETPPQTNPTPWSPESSPTQVILVDIIQSLTLPPLGSNGRRLAVMISAWDKAEDAGMTPDDYLRVHLPLLQQFLCCSGSFSKVKVFGVSALGGDLDSKTDSDRLKAEDVPSKRIRVVEGDHMDALHDLTIPVQWLIARG